MTIDNFEQELHAIDPKLSVKPSGKVPGLAGVYWNNEYLFAIPDKNIYDEVNNGYAAFLPSGVTVRHRTRPEALFMAKKLVSDIKKGGDYGDAFMGVGKYSKKGLEL